MSSITMAKLGLTLCSALILLCLCICVPQFHDAPIFYFLYLFYAAANALLPDFVYRGIENMKMITVATLIIRTLFLLGVFLFVSGPSNYILVPLLYFLGAVVADIFIFLHLKAKYNVYLMRISLRDIIESMRASAGYFVSRIASTFYSSFSTMILGFIMPGSIQLGQFTACNSAANAGKNLSSPIADSIYPYMMRTKDYRLLRKVVCILMLVLLPASIVVSLFSNDICAFLFGPEYRDAGPLLSALVYSIPIASASYVLGFPALTPLGLAGAANRSVVIGAAVQVVILICLWGLGAISALSVCVATVITEAVVLGVRVTALCSHRGELI